MIDNGRDQSIINITSFLTLTNTSTFYYVGGALREMTSESLLKDVNASCTLALLTDGSKVILQND